MRCAFTCLAFALTMLGGCKPKSVTCSTYGMDHGSTPSHLPTSFSRDVATAKFSSCTDGRTYSVQCRHGSMHTTCECAVDGVTRVKVKTSSSEQLDDDRAAATAFANTKCEWALR